jgi:general stress protein YciG
MPPTKMTRTEQNQKNGRLGGEATAKKIADEVAQLRGERGGASVLKLYGREFYVSIRKRRTKWPKTYKKRKDRIREVKDSQ